MMNITVFGAAGDVGSRVVNEALLRGHTVTAVVRKAMQLKALPKSVKGVIGHADNLEDVKHLSKNQDLIVSAVRPPQGEETLLADVTDSILTGAALHNVRSIIVGGAASLTIPGNPNSTVLTEPNFLPQSVVSIATACFKQHKVVNQHASKNWTYISPPAMLRPGERKGTYRIGKDELMYDAEGKSHISMEDFSIAILDEAEKPQHKSMRFTVAY